MTEAGHFLIFKNRLCEILDEIEEEYKSVFNAGYAKGETDEKFRTQIIPSDRIELEKKYESCLKENTGLKVHNTYLEKKLSEAKELIKELLDTQSNLDPYRDIFKDRILEAEQFLKECNNL